MNNETTYGKLLCEAPHRDYIMDRIIGVISTSFFSILLILLVFYVTRDFFSNRNTSVTALLFTMAVLIFVIIILRYVFFPMAISQRFRIYENGISPHRRPLRFYLKRLEYFIPFDEIEKIGISKTTHSGKCIVIHNKNWNQIVVEKCDTDSVVFDKLLELVERDRKRLECPQPNTR